MEGTFVGQNGRRRRPPRRRCGRIPSDDALLGVDKRSGVEGVVESGLDLQAEVGFLLWAEWQFSRNDAVVLA